MIDDGLWPQWRLQEERNNLIKLFIVLGLFASATLMLVYFSITFAI